MMSNVILDAWVAWMEASAAWVAIVGEKRIYPEQSSRAVQVPSAEYSIIWQREDELFWMMGVQIDLFGKSRSQVEQMESELYARTHRDTSRIIGGLRMWMMYDDGREGGNPRKAGEYFHKSVDYEMRALRKKYALAVQS